MNDDPQQSRDPQHSADQAPEVGSVGEEAAKLFGALAGAARQRGGDLGDGLAGLADHVAVTAHDVDQHLATGAAECRYCPVCRVVHAVRETSPEVRAHLTQAATSLLQAAAGLLEALPTPDESEPARRRSDVERIDLDDQDGEA